MSATSIDETALSPTKRALLEIRDLRARLTAFERAAAEPIAIIGLGCRLPGGVIDEASLWRVLSEGTDTVREVPGDRWDARTYYDPDPDRPGAICTATGGFLDDVAGFDARFFGIAPREAASMDPQQRLMLEVAWEALENAAIAPDTLERSATGVYLGVGNSDYGRMLFASRYHIDAYAGSGGSFSVIAGRLAYLLGLQGPAIVVDTACSASLVAVHIACQALRRGECDLALAGGVNLMLSPDAHIAFTKARMLSADGRCKTFDAAADGYGRGEGAAAIVLRRLSDASARGERVLALIRGSAVNQDGRSNGLTAPNGPAQEAVIRAALANARISPSQVDYVEAHGTGTSLGDPIELQALAAAFGEQRLPEQPLLVGSCKTNFGHLEAAAGITGLIKVIAALRHRSIPPHLHLRSPNPLVDWASLRVRVATELQPWPQHEEPARAGVSSFGFSGTNAHVILEEAPNLPDHPGRIERPLHVLTLSACDEAGLADTANRFRVSLVDGSPVAGLCFTANTGRVHQRCRVTVHGAKAADFDAGLSAFLSGVPHPSVVAGLVGKRLPVIGFLFTGQGAQYHGMARQLYETSPLFSGVIDECASILDQSFDLMGTLYNSPDCINETAFAQPALFAIEVALARLWRSWGVEPSVMIGHSLGEYAAACAADVMPLADGLRLIVERGRLTQALPCEGAMVSVFAIAETVLEQIAALGLEVSIAAYNGPQHVVVSGVRSEIDKLTAHQSARAIRCKPLRVSQAFHSPLIEPALTPFAEALARVNFRPASHPIISNLHGRIAQPDELANSSYWLQQMRAPVRFEECIRAAFRHGVTHFIEVGPHPVLLGMAADWASSDTTVKWLASLRRDASDWTNLLDSMQHLYADGARIDWREFDRPYDRRPVTAPTTPFQRRRHWIDWTSPSLHAPAGELSSCWERVSAALTRQAQQAPVGLDLTGYTEKWASLEQLTTAYAVTALRAAGIFCKSGERANCSDVQQRLGAPRMYIRLIERWLQLMAKSNALRKDADAYVCERPLREPDLEACLNAVRLQLNDQPLLDYIEQCGRLLYSVVTGKESPLETLFPDGSFELAENLYSFSAPMRHFNSLAAGAVEALITSRGAHSAMRVLEIGAGTGSTSSSLIPLFNPQLTTYWFTDVTSAFLDHAHKKFGELPFLRFAKFDLEGDPAAQGFAPQSFDLIVAANAVHASRDLRESLRKIQMLLAPGGTLLLIETTQHLAWFDISTGLIEGWQHFADDLRDDSPLLPPAAWVRAVREAGFDAAGAWPPDDCSTAQLGQRVIAAWVAGNAGADARASAGLSSDEPTKESLGGRVSMRREATASSSSAAFTAQLAQALPDEQLELMRNFVREHIMRVLRLDADQAPGRHDRLMDLGLDSLMAVRLRNLLGAGLGFAKPLPATLMFDYPTIEALASHLLDHMAALSSAPSVAAANSASERPNASPSTRLDESQLAEMSETEVEAMLLSRLDAQ